MIEASGIKTYTLVNSKGIKATITNFGGKVMSLCIPDRNGRFDDVVLGYDEAVHYLVGKSYFGALIGRFANRIAGGKFNIDGQSYQLALNNGTNALHGGPNGFHNVLWEVESYKAEDGQALRLSYCSKDGEEGFPGALNVQVIYTLTGDNAFSIAYQATGSATTVVNMTHHSFFNLRGEGNGDILDHKLMINAEYFTPVDETMIPTGELKLVAGTPFDFRKPRLIREQIDNENDQLQIGNGYDHNWVLQKNEPLSMAALLSEPSSGRVMEVWTTQPGLQIYTGNNLNDKVVGKGGSIYSVRSAICLEAQHFPDSPNHSNFPTTVLPQGKQYTHETVYKFGVN